MSERIKSGLIVLMGNNLSPVNYPANAYRFRQDSSFLYYFGLHREGLVGVIDTDENKEWLIGDDIDIETSEDGVEFAEGVEDEFRSGFGELVGIGTHDTLLENCEVYQEIYYSQMDRKEGF